MLATEDGNDLVAYFSQTDPGLCDVDKQIVLGPFSRVYCLFLCKVESVLLEMYLHNQCNAGQH